MDTAPMTGVDLSLWKKLAVWADRRGRREGWLAWALMRLTGLGLVAYLGIHMVALGQLAMGPAAYDAFVAFAHSPLILTLDGVLIFGLCFHGLNGLRVTLLGLGYGVRLQAALFWGVLTLSIILTIVAMVAILSM